MAKSARQVIENKESGEMIGNIAREPNGRKRRPPPSERIKEREEDILSVAMAQPHRRGLVSLNRRDERRNQLAESPFGQLYLRKELSEAQYNAGLFWRRLVGRMRWASISPSDRPARLLLADKYGFGRDPTDEEALEARREYEDALYHVRNQFAVWNGHRVLMVLKAVCCQDRACQDLGLLKLALNVLIRYHDLTRASKKAKVTLL